MAARKKAAAKTAKADAPKAADNEKPLEATHESPISTTGVIPVFRADLGESLPPQKHAGVE